MKLFFNESVKCTFSYLFMQIIWASFWQRSHLARFHRISKTDVAWMQYFPLKLLVKGNKNLPVIIPLNTTAARMMTILQLPNNPIVFSLKFIRYEGSTAQRISQYLFIMPAKVKIYTLFVCVVPVYCWR